MQIKLEMTQRWVVKSKNLILGASELLFSCEQMHEFKSTLRDKYVDNNISAISRICMPVIGNSLGNNIKIYNISRYFKKNLAITKVLTRHPVRAIINIGTVHTIWIKYYIKYQSKIKHNIDLIWWANSVRIFRQNFRN